MPINPIGSTPPTPPPQRKDSSENEYQQTLGNILKLYENNDPQDALVNLFKLMQQVQSSGGSPDQIAKVLGDLKSLQNLIQNNQPQNLVAQQTYVAQADAANL